MIPSNNRREYPLRLTERLMYLTYKPKPPLSKFVDSFWLYEGHEAEHKTDAEDIFIIGVHFKPGGAFPFLGLPAGDLADPHVNLETLWGPSAGRLRERLCEARTSAERFQLLHEALLSRLCHGVEQHYAVSAALEMFGKNQAGPRVREAAKYLGLSQRRFIQVFKAEVGMIPKLFSRVQRFQRVRTLIEQMESSDWIDIAMECGYFDQSHLIREFHELSGISPAAYLRQHDRFLEQDIHVKNNPPSVYLNQVNFIQYKQKSTVT